MFNDLFGDHGLLPLAIAPGPGAPFDRITVEVPDEMRESGPDCPLVTIIMSTFKPDQSLRTAVGSLINQTWQNLEILLVDDCSPPEFDGLLHEAAAMDPRIRLIRMEQNGGTYKIRNFAISVASGEFIAFKDSDDWAHPERIERQVRPLLESAELVGTTCSSIRVNANLGVSSVGFSPARQCASSPVFRRRLVMDTLGGFDAVRKAGDTEFTRRIELVFGVDAFPEVPHPLVLTQLTPGSLSRAEFGFGWHHGARVLHREAYRYWHRVIGRGSASPTLDPADPRPFVSPERLSRSGAAQPEQCDVLMISDWGDLVDRYVGVPREVLALADAGLSTRIAQSQSVRYGHRDRHPPSDDILELQERGKTRFALWDEDLHARVLLVRDPEILNFTRPANKVKFRADRLVIVAGYPCRAPEGGWLTYDPSAVERHARQMFGVEPEWLPGHDGIAESLLAEGAEATILSPQRVGVVEPRRRPFSGVRGGRRPVVGTTGLKAPLKDRPTMNTMRQMLPDDDDYDVRISADRELIDKIRRGEHLPVNWLVLDEPDPSTFLRQLDFFVGMPKRSWGPELSWAALEAIAHGALAILDPAYEEQFGDAAVYAPAAEVKDAVDAFVKDPEEFARQQSRGYDFCVSQVSDAALREVVFTLGGFTRDNTKGMHA
ncbi:MAG: glycosyltransferase family 2 protein [Aeromicrobium sp.]